MGDLSKLLYMNVTKDTLERRNIKVTESRLKLFFATLPERIIASYTFDILVALFAFVFLLKIGACKIVQFKFQEF